MLKGWKEVKTEELVPYQRRKDELSVQDGWLSSVGSQSGGTSHWALQSSGQASSMPSWHRPDEKSQPQLRLVAGNRPRY